MLEMATKELKEEVCNICGLKFEKTSIMVEKNLDHVLERVIALQKAGGQWIDVGDYTDDEDTREVYLDDKVYCLHLEVLTAKGWDHAIVRVKDPDEDSPYYWRVVEGW